jgi:hypothetical protein
VKADDIVRNLELLGQELEQRGVTGEILIAGGAFMLLVIKNRDTTKDIDAYFATEPQAIREAAQVVAEREGLAPDWLNDGVTGFFHQSPPTELWAEYPGLRVYTVTSEYVFAPKAIAGRPKDVPDLEALRAHLRLTSLDDALATFQKYVPQRLVPARTQYLLETMFDDEE